MPRPRASTSLLGETQKPRVTIGVCTLRALPAGKLTKRGGAWVANLAAGQSPGTGRGAGQEGTWVRGQCPRKPPMRQWEGHGLLQDAGPSFESP